MKKTLRPFPFIAIFFLTELFLFWPGILRVDSFWQLEQALSHSFNDHHPPLMALYWSILNKLYPGPGLMLVTHLLLFWGSIYNFIRSFKDKFIQSSYFLIAILPPLLMFHPFILKDIGFAHSYFFVISRLVYYTLEEKKPSLWGLIGLLIILFYGTAIKFQGIFILPILAIWIGKIFHTDYKNTITAGICIFTVFYTTISFFNAKISKPSQAWQYVKLYDIAGITLRTGKNYFPPFITHHNGFSEQRLKELYNPIRVDDLVFIPDPVLIKGKNNQQAKEVWSYWFKAIKAHPLAYLNHRFSIFKKQITQSFIKPPSEIRSHQENIHPKLLKIGSYLEKWNIIQLAKILTAFSLYLFLQFIYFCIGIYYRHSPLGKVTLFVNSIGLTLVLTLFFFSMAAEARYTYLSMGCLHFSHPFIWLLTRKKIK